MTPVPKIIPFNADHRLLAKVIDYYNHIDKLIEEADSAVEMLIKAMDLADDTLKLKIVLMLGTLARPQVIDPLYRVMKAFDQSDFIRQTAAVQLNVAGSMVPDTQNLVARLIVDLSHVNSFDRANAAIALGWQGNSKAIPYLVKALDDDDTDVQQAAVNALSNIKDDSIVFLLARCLPNGTKQRRRAVLYNLWRFAPTHPEIIVTYLEYLHHSDADLRYDALVVFNQISRVTDYLRVYRQCLQDSDARIRQLALGRLAAIHPKLLMGLKCDISPLVQDPNTKVRRAALKLLHHICPAKILSADKP